MVTYETFTVESLLIASAIVLAVVLGGVYLYLPQILSYMGAVCLH